MPDELTESAKELIATCPHLINLFAERISKMIENWAESDVYHDDVLMPIDIEIQHVGYTAEQCGYDK